MISACLLLACGTAIGEFLALRERDEAVQRRPGAVTAMEASLTAAPRKTSRSTRPLRTRSRQMARARQGLLRAVDGGDLRDPYGGPCQLGRGDPCRATVRICGRYAPSALANRDAIPLALELELQSRTPQGCLLCTRRMKRSGRQKTRPGRNAPCLEATERRA